MCEATNEAHIITSGVYEATDENRKSIIGHAQRVAIYRHSYNPTIVGRNVGRLDARTVSRTCLFAIRELTA
jgi:hypothetical protein